MLKTVKHGNPAGVHVKSNSVPLSYYSIQTMATKLLKEYQYYLLHHWLKMNSKAFTAYNTLKCNISDSRKIGNIIKIPHLKARQSKHNEPQALFYINSCGILRRDFLWRNGTIESMEYFWQKPITILSTVSKYLDEIEQTQLIKCFRQHNSTRINIDSEATNR